MVRANSAARNGSSARPPVYRPHGFALVHEHRQLDAPLEGHAARIGAASAGRNPRIASILACLVAGVITAPAQVSSDVALSNGVQLTINTRAQEGTPVALKASLEPASGNSFYRIFRDDNN